MAYSKQTWSSNELITADKLNHIEDGIPTKTSQLTNDSGFLTSHQSITGKKNTQNAVSSPDAIGTAIAFIDTISQDTQGVISPTKKTVATATTSDAGLMSADDKTKLDETLVKNDIANNLSTATTGKVLDASQGKVLNDTINNLTPANIGLENVENKSSATIRGELTKENVTTALGYTPPTTNTWRGIQDNLTSTSTTDSLSANQGKILKDAIDECVNIGDYNPEAKTSAMTKVVGKDSSGKLWTEPIEQAEIISATESWLDTHVDPQTGYVVDNSLSISGAAADAAACGELKSAITWLDTDIYNGYKSVPLNWEHGWVNSAGGYDATSNRFLIQGKSTDDATTVYNDSVNLMYVVYFDSYTNLTNFTYNSYDVIPSNTTYTIDKTKPFFLIESLATEKSGLNGVQLTTNRQIDYLSKANFDAIYNTLNSNKITNAIAYVSENNITWSMSGETCTLTIGANIVVRANYETESGNIIKQITTQDLFDAVQASGLSTVSVSDEKIVGTSFAIVFSFDDNNVKVFSPTNKNVFNNSVILFVNHYLSYTGGLLVESVVNTLKTKIDEISPILPDYLTNETTACFNELVSDCGEKAFVIAFTTDNHYGASNGSNFPTTVSTIMNVNERFPIDIIVDGGDLINGDETKQTAINRISSAVEMLARVNKPFYTLVGNHDDDSFTVSQQALLTKPELYALLQRHSIVDLDFVDEIEHYGYKDFEQFDLRVVFLDAVYDSNGSQSSSWGYSDAELAWFSADALNTQKQVVMFSHMAFTPDFSAYGETIKNGIAMRVAVENFISNGGVVVALFHGHNHWDYIGKASATNGFHEVSTGCGRIISGPNIPYSHPTGATMPERTSGTVTQELWDIIVIKPESRTVNMVRYGAGSDRTFTY